MVREQQRRNGADENFSDESHDITPGCLETRAGIEPDLYALAHRHGCAGYGIGCGGLQLPVGILGRQRGPVAVTFGWRSTDTGRRGHGNVVAVPAPRLP